MLGSKNQVLETFKFGGKSLERIVFIKLAIPLLSSRRLNVKNDPGYSSKDWESDNYKVEHRELIFRVILQKRVQFLEFVR